MRKAGDARRQFVAQTSVKIERVEEFLNELCRLVGDTALDRMALYRGHRDLSQVGKQELDCGDRRRAETRGGPGPSICLS